MEANELKSAAAPIQRWGGIASFLLAVSFVASSLIFQSRAGPSLFGYPALGLVGFLVAAFLGFWLAIGIIRSGRL